MRSTLIIYILAVLTIVALTFIGGLLSHTHQETVDVTVTGKERVVTHNNSYYLVFTESEVFKNEDTMLGGKWNSSDVQSKLQPGHTYRVTVYGWRVPILSMYRNILKVHYSH